MSNFDGADNFTNLYDITLDTNVYVKLIKHPSILTDHSYNEHHLSKLHLNFPQMYAYAWMQEFEHLIARFYILGSVNNIFVFFTINFCIWY